MTLYFELSSLELEYCYQLDWYYRSNHWQMACRPYLPLR